jgi:hypothetical protein
VLRVGFGVHVGVKRKQIIAAIDLDAMPREKEESYIVGVEQLAKRLEILVHLFDGAVLSHDNIEAVALELCAKIGRVVYRIIEIIVVRVRGIAEYQRRHGPLQCTIPCTTRSPDRDNVGVGSRIADYLECCCSWVSVKNGIDVLHDVSAHIEKVSLVLDRN